ncbi:MAG: DUF4132 domain-containing protein [Verrucomicrobiota bacterium]
MSEGESFEPVALVEKWVQAQRLEVIDADIRNLSEAQLNRMLAFVVRDLIRTDANLPLLRAELPLADFRGEKMEAWQKAGHRLAMLVGALSKLLERGVPLTEGVAQPLLDWLAGKEYPCHVSIGGGAQFISVPVAGVVRALERFAKHNPLSMDLKHRIIRLVETLRGEGTPKEHRQLGDRLERLVEGTARIKIYPGEAWADAALADLHALSDGPKTLWAEFVNHCHGAKGSAPSAKWLKTAETLLKQIGFAEFKQRMLAWFPLVDKPRTQSLERPYDWGPDPNQLITPLHADLLRAFAWCCALQEDNELARALTALAVSTYRKIPQLGPRATKVGNACVHALGTMPGMAGVGQLAYLKVRVKFGTAQKGIEKALNTTAERVGIPREDLEEMGVPAYGLTSVGECVEEFGEFKARLHITGTTDTELTWLKADGSAQKSIPASVKKDFAEDLKELQGAAKDIQRMLPAQRDRLDNLFLQQKSWPLAAWRERYLDHPLVGTLARRLIWQFTTGNETTAGIWLKDALADVNDQPIAHLREDTVVRLWHPIGCATADIVAWREWLERHGVQQPFKQAHREIYVLTDAERATRMYSNRYAAHIIRQHQYNALCAVRGWKNKLRLMVDDTYPPTTLHLPKWNLRAEFWVEGVGDNYGTDTNESGVYLRLATDQVRFYPIDAAQRMAHASGGGYYTRDPVNDGPVPLEEIPPLVLSEVMRDVDLFVGVASVGNDPDWADGGPGGRYRNYWQEFAFGGLSGTATMRKEVLQRLLPRLKIAPLCSFTERFLEVRGTLHTYKIHLGSGNILMSPDDRYLCIVPRQGGATAADKVFLPFEGDNLLAIILSKAFLLADDDKIKDPTIVSQLKR